MNYIHSNTVSEGGVPVQLTFAFDQCSFEPHNLCLTALSVSSVPISNVKISVCDVVMFVEKDDEMIAQVSNIVQQSAKILLTVHILVIVKYSKEM